MAEAGSAVAKKVVAIMGELETLRMKGRNEFHKYNYARDEDIADALRPLMHRHGLACMPTVEDFRRDGDIVTLLINFRFIDADTGDMIECRVYGEGQDKGDKGTYKAMTGATKYALLKTFHLSASDDPEASMDQTPAQRTGAVQRARGNAPSQSAPVAPPANPALDGLRTEVSALSHELGTSPAAVLKRLEAIGDDEAKLTEARDRLKGLVAERKAASA